MFKEGNLYKITRKAFLFRGINIDNMTDFYNNNSPATEFQSGEILTFLMTKDYEGIVVKIFLYDNMFCADSAGTESAAGNHHFEEVIIK